MVDFPAVAHGSGRGRTGGVSDPTAVLALAYLVGAVNSADMALRVKIS